jgi:chemotaxis protein MotB
MTEKIKKPKRKSPFAQVAEGGEAEKIGVWILSYSDMMTLLFAFFVLIAGMSSINKQLYEEVAASMAEGMKKPSEKPLTKIVDQVKEIIKDEHLEGKLSVKLDKDGAKISFTGQALFDVGKADLHVGIFSTLNKLADILKKDTHSHYIIVEGHTDNVPMKSEIFPSNWELSSARSATVIRYLIEHGVPSERCKAVGYAETQPETLNTTEDGRSKNRRVVIKLSKNVKE